MKKRDLLKAMALGTTGTMMLPFLNSPAFAQTGNGGGPMRLLCLATGYGGRWDYFRPRGLGETYENDRWTYDADRTALTCDLALTANSINYTDAALKPLAPYANRMTILEGLSFDNALIVIDNGQKTIYSGHEHSPGNMFTGSKPRWTNEDVFTYSPSLDYYLGQALGGSNPIRSLQMGLGGTAGQHLYDSVAFDNNGQRLPGMTDANQTFRYLMGNGGAAENSQLAGQQAMLKSLQNSAERLRARLESGERKKLDSHLSGLAEIERQLNSMVAPLSCAAPASPATNPRADGPNMNKHTDVMFEILAQGFACDRTRFASAAWGLQSGTFAPWLAADVHDWHNEVAHNAGGGSDNPAEIPLIEKANRDMAKLQHYYATALKKFMDRLDSIPEGDGTVLDNTLIIWAQDFGPWAHIGLNVPYVLLGGGGGKFRMGRYRSFHNGNGTMNINSYQPNNKLFNTVLQGFGVDTNNFGGISGTLAGVRS